MNLLVTNTRNAQAYGIIRSLRPHAKKIVVTMYGPNRFVARLSHAANSGYVDKRYLVPSPVEDWRTGRLQKENTEREEEYIRAILRICEYEGIDVIFPSWEPLVYVFSKNMERFRARRIVLPIPDVDVLVAAMDKYRVIKTAEEVGFPCPRSFAVEEASQLGAIARHLEYPALVKPRFSSGSRGLFLVRNHRELVESVSAVERSRGLPLVQEYIPGSVVQRFSSIWIVLDRDYELKAHSLHRKLRTIFRDASSQGSAWESFKDDGLIGAATGLCRALKLTGPVNIQTKQDPRDGRHKLLEVNPRLGYNFWIPQAMGLDTPLLALKVATGERFDTIQARTGKTVFISPPQDVAAFGMYLIELFATKVLRYRPVDSDNLPPGLTEFLRSYKDTYTAPTKAIDPYFSEFFRDPLVSLTWWAAFGVFSVQQKLRWIFGLRMAHGKDEK